MTTATVLKAFIMITRMKRRVWHWHYRQLSSSYVLIAGWLAGYSLDSVQLFNAHLFVITDTRNVNDLRRNCIVINLLNNHIHTEKEEKEGRNKNTYFKKQFQPFKGCSNGNGIWIILIHDFKENFAILTCCMRSMKKKKLNLY